MAKRSRKKYRLLVYSHMLNRWWPATLALGIVLIGYAALLWSAENFWPKWPLPRLSLTHTILLLTAGAFCLGMSVFLATVSRFAYVQLFETHLRLVTPFLRLNLGYKRIHRTTPAEMAALFPPKSISSWRREILAPLASLTAVVVHLKSYPLPRFWLSLFLSPFFFYDKTPHLVLLVDDWMSFSTALESARSLERMPRPPDKPKPSPRKLASGLLDSLK